MISPSSFSLHHLGFIELCHILLPLSFFQTERPCDLISKTERYAKGDNFCGRTSCGEGRRFWRQVLLWTSSPSLCRPVKPKNRCCILAASEHQPPVSEEEKPLQDSDIPSQGHQDMEVDGNCHLRVENLSATQLLKAGRKEREKALSSVMQTTACTKGLKETGQWGG